MKKILRFLVVAMLFAMTGASFEIAAAKKSCSGRVKSDCTGSCEWRNKKCRHKVNNRSNAAAGNTSTSTGSQVIDSEESDSVNAGNGGPVDNQPQIFTPAAQFAGDNLICYYDSDNRRAQIANPSNPSNSYYFINVQAIASAGVQRQGTLIGSFDTPNWTPPAPGIVGYKEKITQLYGTPASADQVNAGSQIHHGGVVGNPISIDALYQTFLPNSQFGGSLANYAKNTGILGHYFKSTQTATISDFSGASSTSYSFINVVTGGATCPAGLTLIGTIPQMTSCSGCADTTVYIYGNIVPRND